ncbi:ABC-2 type transport system ATP-binding protein [Enterococcus rotai]|uniref:ABC transporter ATP-binding protein n=1 Tax=Enterococcus rotai TaxID=118060 RepID=UPI001FC91A3A|nr:ABC transporter ATP-binding protein [Enterococcus rotai]
MDRINFNFESNNIVGIIGHNGSGKTTLLEILCGLRKFDSGEMNIEINNKYRQKLGVILQENAFYESAKVYELLELFASFYEETFNIEKLIELIGIKKYQNKTYRSLSGGMKQKVNIALAIINKPNLLILDEPTTGLDPLAREELWNIIKAFSKDRLIIVSSHYMDEIQQNCSHVLFLKNGKKVFSGEVSELIAKRKKDLLAIYLEENNEKGDEEKCQLLENNLL